MPYPYETTIRRIGDELGLTLPDDALDRYSFSDGDRVHLVMTSNGLLLVPYEQDFEDALAIYEDGATAYDEALSTMEKEAA